MILFAGQTVPAHCCILSACSPFFTERLEREMPPKGHKVVLEIRGLKIGTLRKLVDFLYTSEMEVSREEAQDILAAARQLQVSELESLQLEGGKLVRKSFGPRLNRHCLQLSSPVSISEANLMQPPAPSTGSSLTSLVVAHKQRTAMKLPSAKDSDNSADQKETKKQKTAAALLSGDKQQMPRGPIVHADPLQIKGKKRATGMLKNVSGNGETGSLQLENIGAGERQGTVSFQETKKIKLRRSKLSSPPLPLPSATKDHSTVTSSKSRSSRRRWRQKIPPSKDGTKGPGDSHVQGFWNPPLLPKGRKRNASEPTPSSNPTSEAGQVGRVKLRKVIDGSCWEVVQESPDAEPTRAANTVYALQDKGPLPLSPKEEIVDAQESVSTAKLPAKEEPIPCNEKNLVEQSKSKVVSDEEHSVTATPYELNTFTLEHLAEDEKYGSVASNGELEHMLDLLLADHDVLGESQGTAVPEVYISAPALEAKKSHLGNAETEEKDKSSADMSVCRLLVEREDRPLKREQEDPDLETDKETHGSTNGVILMTPVLSSLPLMAPEPNHDTTLCKAATFPELDERAVPEHQSAVIENGTTRFSEAAAVILAGDKEHEPLSHGLGISGTEAQPQTQVMLKNSLWHSLDCKLLPFLANLEEEELDVGGVEELFVSAECVRPDRSPVSETEVDVLS